MDEGAESDADSGSTVEALVASGVVKARPPRAVVTEAWPSRPEEAAAVAGGAAETESSGGRNGGSGSRRAATKTSELGHDDEKSTTPLGTASREATSGRSRWDLAEDYVGTRRAGDPPSCYSRQKLRQRRVKKCNDAKCTSLRRVGKMTRTQKKNWRLRQASKR